MYIRPMNFWNHANEKLIRIGRLLQKSKYNAKNVFIKTERFSKH